LREFLTEQGFRSLLAKVGGDAAEAPPPLPVPPDTVPFDHKAYETVVTEAALDRWIAEAFAAGAVALHVEGDGRESVRAAPVGISLATAPGRACYIPFGHAGDDLLSAAPTQLDLAPGLDRLRLLFAHPGVLKIGHDLKDSLILLRRHGVDVTPYDDTILLSDALDAGRHGHGLDELCRLHHEHDPIPFKEICGSGKARIGFAQVPPARATEYAGEYADVTFRLWRTLKPRLPREAATRVYELVDRPLVSVVAEMERAGVLVDRRELARLSGVFAVEIERLEGEIHALAGGPFTIGSPKQLGEVLFDRLGFTGGRKGKSGVYSTDMNELERLAGQGAVIADKVLEWRQLSKLKSTYTDALQAEINPETERVHTSFGLAIAQTGRLSSTNPNLQNIPIRTEIGRRIRDAFIAAPGHVLLSADYSQIELRLAAHMADVPTLKDAFARGDDIHAITARELFGTVDRDTRGKAKTINFAILYGISAWGLAGRLGMERGEAQAMIDRYFERFPGINRYIAETLTAVREQGFVTTLFGRKTHLPGIRSPRVNERQAAERQAINAPIQGTSADIIKRAMARMPPALAAAGLDEVRMLLQVHDELVFELPEQDVAAASAVVARTMAEAATPAVTLAVPLGVEIGTGKSWGDAH
jgi:DNA polymerase-1